MSAASVLKKKIWYLIVCITYLKSTLNSNKISTFLQYKHIGFSAVFGINGQLHILFRIASSDSNAGFGIMSQVSEEIASSFSSHTCLGIWIMSLQDQWILMAIREDNIYFRDIVCWSWAMFVRVIAWLIKTISDLDPGYSRLMWDSFLSWLMWNSISWWFQSIFWSILVFKIDLERTWLEVLSFLGGSGGSVFEDEPRFGRFEVLNFQVRSNIKWKIYPFFDILCSKKFWFGLRFGGSKFGFRAIGL